MHFLDTLTTTVQQQGDTPKIGMRKTLATRSRLVLVVTRETYASASFYPTAITNTAPVLRPGFETLAHRSLSVSPSRTCSENDLQG